MIFTRHPKLIFFQSTCLKDSTRSPYSPIRLLVDPQAFSNFVLSLSGSKHYTPIFSSYFTPTLFSYPDFWLSFKKKFAESGIQFKEPYILYGPYLTLPASFHRMINPILLMISLVLTLSLPLLYLQFSSIRSYINHYHPSNYIQPKKRTTTTIDSQIKDMIARAKGISGKLNYVHITKDQLTLNYQIHILDWNDFEPQFKNTFSTHTLNIEQSSIKETENDILDCILIFDRS